MLAICGCLGGKVRKKVFQSMYHRCVLVHELNGLTKSIGVRRLILFFLLSDGPVMVIVDGKKGLNDETVIVNSSMYSTAQINSV